MTKRPKVLKNLKKDSVGRLFSLLAIIFSIAFVQPAFADGTKLQKITYDIYAGGFHVVKANFEVDFRKQNKYRLELGAHTRGFIGKIAPWEGTFTTKGWYDAKTKTATPEMHMSWAHWKDEEEIKEYTYNRDGTFGEYRVTDVHNDRDLREADPALSDNTTDVMTAALDIMNSMPETGKCEGEHEVFDGKRRFKMMFIDEGQVELRASRYNIYSGLAQKCIVQVEPMGGAWHKKPRGWASIQEQGRENGKMPTLWMANITEGKPAVPVKMLVRTNYGALVMHMTRYENGDKVLLAEKQADDDE